MDEKLIQSKAADAILERGVLLPFLHIKVPFKRKRIVFNMTMKQPPLGTIIKISKLYLKLGFTAEEIERFSSTECFAFFAEHGKTISQMIALTIMSSYLGSKFSGILAWLIRWRIPLDYQRIAMEQFISQLAGTKDFTNFIVSVARINPMASQARKRS